MIRTSPQLRIEVGSIRIERIVELQDIEVAANWLLVNIAEVDPDVRHFPISMGAFLIRTAKHTILVDTGCGNGKSRPGQPLFEKLQTDFIANLYDAGVSPDEVNFVLLTHLHFDHVGWNTVREEENWRPTFRNAKYLMMQKEYEFWQDAIASGNGSPATRAAFVDSVDPIVAAGQAVFLQDVEVLSDFLNDGISLFGLPGHTPWQVGVAIRDGHEEALIVADALHHPLQISYPTLRNGGDVDRLMALTSRQCLIEQCAASGSLILASHFEATNAAGYVEKTGAGFRFVSRSFQL